MARTKGIGVSTAGKSVTLAEKMTAWQHRERSSGVDWRDVSATSLRAAITATLSAGGALMIGGAMGGKGVMLKVWVGDDQMKEYAATAEEVCLLLDGLVEGLGSGSEDLYEALRGGVE